MSCKLKRIHRALSLYCSSYISNIVWWLPMFDFCIFRHLLRLMGIYRVGPSSGYLKSFVLSFLFFVFFFFFSILHFLFLFLPGALLALGPLDIVHPCHPVATPLFPVQLRIMCVLRVKHVLNAIWKHWRPLVVHDDMVVDHMLLDHMVLDH